MSTSNKVAPESPTAGANFSLAISVFPEDLHPLLNSLDDEGNGLLELDEITDVFTMYADMKKASKDGSIAISTLPKEIQPTLKVFDVDGDGTVAPMELARAAELYKESKNAVKRLTKMVVGLVLTLGVLLGCLAGMVIAVVEESKETETSSNGITTVKGTNTPASSAVVSQVFVLGDAEGYGADTLDSIDRLRFTTDEDTDSRETYSYTITGWSQATDGVVTFYAARGDTVTVSGGVVTVVDTGGFTLYTETPSRRRHLLFFGGWGASMSGAVQSFTEIFSPPPAPAPEPTPVPAPEPSPSPSPSEMPEPTFSPMWVDTDNNTWMGGDAV